MQAVTVAIFVLTVTVAAANGSNDNAKGVATLAGAGVTRYRTALMWGTAATFAGALASLRLAHGLTALFSKGIVAAHPTPAFALAVLAGTAGWVMVATGARLPVSTTHAVIGALIGAAMLFAPSTIRWRSLIPTLVVPLLLSVAAAYAASLVLNLVGRRIPECVCVELPEATGGLVVTQTGALALFSSGAAAGAARVRTGTAIECDAHRPASRRVELSVNGAHWISSGAASFARGLNDTPKLVAIGAFALLPAGMSIDALLWVIAGAMALGALAAGIRVGRRLGDDVVAMTHLEGFKANLSTAALVGLGATRGLPMSTTHVSTGAIAGTAGVRGSRLNRRAMRDFLLAWTLTPVVAGAVAASVYALAR